MRKRRTTLPIRKRSFLLIEVLISLALIALCLFPLIKPLVAMRQEDRKYIELIQLEMASQHAFCEVKKMLYEHKIPWKSFSKENDFKDVLTKTYEIAFNKGMSRHYTCDYAIRHIETANKPSKKAVGLAVEVKLIFTSGSSEKKFSRTLYLEKHNT
jgi:hypothetical protein